MQFNYYIILAPWCDDSPWSLGKCIVGSQYIMIGDLSRPASRSKPLWKLGLLGRNETPDCTLPTTAAEVPLTVVLSESVRPPVDLFTTIITTPQALNHNTHLRSSSFRYHKMTPKTCIRNRQQRHNTPHPPSPGYVCALRIRVNDANLAH